MRIVRAKSASISRIGCSTRRYAPPTLYGSPTSTTARTSSSAISSSSTPTATRSACAGSRAEVHRINYTQDTGRAAFGQQPAQPCGRVGDVLRQAGALSFGAVLVAGFSLGRRAGLGSELAGGLAVRAAVQAPAGQPRGLQPEFLAGRGQVR